MATSFPVTIVSPARAVFSGEASLVEIPGSEGDFGVLAGHSPVFSMLRPGIITVHRDGADTKRYFAASGYADVSPEGATILSEQLYDLNEVTPDLVEKLVATAQKALNEAESPAETEKAQAMLLNAETLRMAVSH